MPDKTPTPRSGDHNSPFFQSMQREMNQFFDRFRSREMSTPAEFFDAFTGPAFPALDVVETDEAMEITAEVPGVTEEDLDVTVSHDTLILKGEKSNQHEETKADIHFVERRYGSFRRQIPLGFVPADGGVQAQFQNGVLKLRVLKPEETRKNVQKIEISKG